MVTTVTDNSPQSINTSLFSLDKEVQEIKKVTDKLKDVGFDSNVISVNGKRGIVELNASDVGALPDTTVIPTKTSELTNDSGFITIDVACPVGTILSGLYTTAPGGFLLCNGQEVAIADYPELYAVIGSLEICKSSNKGMFKLPNMQDSFLQGANENLGTMKEAGLPNITGEAGMFANTGLLGNDAHYIGGVTRGSYYPSRRPENYVGGGSYALKINASSSNPIYGKSDTVQPPAVCVNYVIKY